MKDIKKKLSRVDVFPELAPYILVLKIIEINDLLLVSKILDCLFSTFCRKLLYTCVCYLYFFQFYLDTIDIIQLTYIIVFKVYNKMVWYMYILQKDYHSKLIPITPQLQVLLSF